jgi:hypothetical protein
MPLYLTLMVSLHLMKQMLPARVIIIQVMQLLISAALALLISAILINHSLMATSLLTILVQATPGLFLPVVL